jgi:tungstate transport system substrate-binding protein
MRKNQTWCTPFILITGLCLLLAVAACGRASESKNIILATTTSTQDSGLLDVLLPVFEKQTGYFVKTIAVGSGQAMSMGARGEADVLLVHSPDDEKKFMEAGNGSRRMRVMYNDFIILGPADDPAGIRSAPDAPEAFKLIAEQEALFISRGDNSGTHAKEKALWRLGGVAPEGQGWYQQTGLGMGQSLAVASEKNGYILADRGTWLALRKNIGLAVVSQGDASLLNIYHVIDVNPEKWPKVNAVGARSFADFLVAPETQKLIGSFGVEKFGDALFVPDAGNRVESPGR